MRYSGEPHPTLLEKFMKHKFLNSIKSEILNLKDKRRGKARFVMDLPEKVGGRSRLMRRITQQTRFFSRTQMRKSKVISIKSPILISLLVYQRK